MDDGSAGGAAAVLAVLLILDAVVYGFGSAVRAWKLPAQFESGAGSGPEAAQPESAGDRKETKRQRLLGRILQNKAEYVDTVQLVTACVNMIVGSVYGVAFSGVIDSLLSGLPAPAAARPVLTVLSCIAAWIVILFIVLVFGVQIPKRLGAAHPEAWVRRCGSLFRILMVITLPLTRLVSVTAKGILYLFGVRGRPLQSDVTEEEIRTMVNEGHEHGVIDQSEAEMISNIFEFSGKEASDIMTQRSDLVLLDGEDTLESAALFMLQQHNSRFPVYQENIDNIVGLIHYRDVMLLREEHPELAQTSLMQCPGLVREAAFIPETKNIDDLFRQMQKDKTQLVIVIDEYGQTAGLIAMEDILEEIVGNLMDEYDVEESHITATSNKNEFFVDGRTPLEELEDRFGMTFDDDRFETVNGFLMSQMDRVPEPNDHFTTDYGGYRFHVLSVADRQVQRVILTKLTE